METKVQKTIFTHEIKHFNFNRKMHWGKGRIITSGVIFLTNGKKIAIIGTQFILVSPNNVPEGIVLKTNPAYRRIKRMIARYFQDYRKGGNLQHLGYWKSRVIDGLHNCNLFRHSDVSFKEHKNDFLKLAS